MKKSTRFGGDEAKRELENKEGMRKPNLRMKVKK
jgi:hypothetical protein